ncbi:DUF4265 domain-containing protein [Kribbella kalugense]|uniref:Uncharacterized protein DUF4265 n=1 Tax=Kribbella kalugense TaxID=2512221 RepID=A0A4R7ZPH2_9ACTN|nr:DUF4265 domain-containing protein [Kribbella kalugense]TDW19276.1 uncharacterized protein DUF4265 [Kribbella kalugense]
MIGYALHRDPVWRERANFIVNAPIEESSTIHTEQLWTRRDPATQLHEICCIPFLIYDLALGDMVAVSAVEDGSYVLDRVIAASGHLTFRIYFGQTEPRLQADVMTDLAKAPIRMERFSENVVALDIEQKDSPQRLADYLAQAQDEGKLVYETGRTL